MFFADPCSQVPHGQMHLVFVTAVNPGPSLTLR
jgi:hypothetical protein